MSTVRHCPFCNNDVIKDRCTQCDYKGPGLTTQQRTEEYKAWGSPKLGDMTGEPRNNGWADGAWGDE
jgi:hypothetical protein